MQSLFPNLPPDHPLLHVFRVLKSHGMLLVVPALGLAFLGGIYGLFSTKQYSATQSLTIRDDLNSDSFDLGRFDTEESLKSAQEMVLEIARNPDVIRPILEELGPPSQSIFGSSGFPSDAAIETVQGKINIGAPNGGEFGKTYGFILSAQESTRERSQRFMELLLDGVSQRLRAVRSDHLLGIQRELEQKVKIANAAFGEASQKLGVLEVELGEDLSAIRSLSVEFPSDGSLAVQVQQIENEIRDSQDKLERAQQQRAILQQAKSIRQGVPTTRELFVMQPTLEIMFRDLAAAKNLRSKDLGRYEEAHFKIKAHDATINDLSEKISKHIEFAIKGVQSQIKTLEASLHRRLEKKAELVKRLKKLASLRVEYDRCKFDASKKQAIYGQAYERLVDARALCESSAESDIVTRVGGVQVSVYPEGPGTKMLVIAGGLGGLLMGLGFIVLLAPPIEDSRSGSQPVSNESSLATVRPEANATQITQTTILSNSLDGPVQTAEEPSSEKQETIRSADLQDLGEQRLRSGNNSESQNQKKCTETVKPKTPSILPKEESKVRDVAFSQSVEDESSLESEPLDSTGSAGVLPQPTEESAATGMVTEDSSNAANSASQMPNEREARKTGGLAKILDELKSGANGNQTGENVLEQLRESLCEVQQWSGREEHEEREQQNEVAVSNVSDSNVSDSNVSDSEVWDEDAEPIESSVGPALATQLIAGGNEPLVPVRREESGTLQMDPNDRPDASKLNEDLVSQIDSLVPERRTDVRPLELLKESQEIPGSAAQNKEEQRSIQPRRVTATEAAESLVHKLRAEHGLSEDGVQASGVSPTPTIQLEVNEEVERKLPPETFESLGELETGKQLETTNQDAPASRDPASTNPIQELLNGNSTEVAFPVSIPDQVNQLGDTAQSVVPVRRSTKESDGDSA